jgi:uncharacterized protein YdaU (DUF1376 family)
MHTYPMHVGDYLKDTAHFDQDPATVTVPVGLVRDLAYRRLLDLYYSREQAIPNKTHWVATHVRLLAYADIVGSVLKEKFDLKEGFWHQKRTDEEIEKYQKRADANRKNGQLGGRKPIKNPPANPLGSKPRTRTRTNKSPLPPEGEMAFGVFWNAYPRKVGRPKALVAYAAALGRGAKAEEILAGLQLHIPCEQWQDLTKVPHPTTWLNRDGWNDQVVSKPAGTGEGGSWWDTKKGVLDRGLRLEVPAPADDSPKAWFAFMAAVWVSAGDGPGGTRRAWPTRSRCACATKATTWPPL